MPRATSCDSKRGESAHDDRGCGGSGQFSTRSCVGSRVQRSARVAIGRTIVAPQRRRRRPPHPPEKGRPMKKPLFAAFVTLTLAAALRRRPVRRPDRRSQGRRQEGRPAKAPPRQRPATRSRSSKRRRRSTSRSPATRCRSRSSTRSSSPSGYSIDLCKRVIVQLGRAAGVSELKINWIVGTVAERIAMVASGKADIDCANTTATQTRMAGRRFLVAHLSRRRRLPRQGQRRCRSSPTSRARTSASSRARRPSAARRAR